MGIGPLGASITRWVSRQSSSDKEHRFPTRPNAMSCGPRVHKRERGCTDGHALLRATAAGAFVASLQLQDRSQDPLLCSADGCPRIGAETHDTGPVPAPHPPLHTRGLPSAGTTISFPWTDGRPGGDFGAAGSQSVADDTWLGNPEVSRKSHANDQKDRSLPR